MEKYKDHNGLTTFDPSVKKMSFKELKETFGHKHDCVKLAEFLGIKVDQAGEPEPENEIGLKDDIDRNNEETPESGFSNSSKPKKKKDN